MRPDLIPTPAAAGAGLHIRPAERERDNARLCALARACPQGDRLRFYHLRDDHWERCRHFPEAEVFVAERGGELVGAATLARKAVWFADDWQSAAYLFDRMVHPAARRQGVGRALLRRQVAASPDAQLRYCLVLEDNHANRAMLEREGFSAHPRRLLYYAILPGMHHRERPREFTFEEPISAETGGKLDAALRASYALADRTAASGDGLFRVGAGTLRAAAVLYRHGPKVFVAAPWYHRLLSRCFSFIPRLHRPVVSWSLGHVWGEGPLALAELLAGVAWSARRAGIAAILLPLYEDDPNCAALRRHTVNRWGIVPTPVCLYLHGELAPAVLRSDRPLLASARDG